MGSEHKNIWGASGGLDAQRNDLWRLDLGMIANAVIGRQSVFQLASNGTSETLSASIGLNNSWYYARSISFPDQKVTGEVYRQHSTPVYFPSWDEAIGTFQIVFVHDTNKNGAKLPGLLSDWRDLVRGGRTNGGVLGEDYKPVYAFDISAILLSGSRAAADAAGAGAALSSRQVFLNSFSSIDSDLNKTGGYTFKKAWLSSFKTDDLTYDGASGILKITAQFYCRSISPILSIEVGGDNYLGTID